MNGDRGVEDKIPDRRRIVRGSPPVGREKRELDRDGEREHLPLDPAEDDEEVGEKILGRVDAEEEGQLQNIERVHLSMVLVDDGEEERFDAPGEEEPCMVAVEC